MAKELHLNIYGNIGEDFFYGEGVTARYVSDKLADATDARKIILHVNSFGGSVYEGFAIYNLLIASGKKIKAIIEGSCASMATLIALSAEEIEMMPFSQWLIHNPSCFVEGDSNDLEKAQQELLRIEDLLINAYVSRTGKTSEEIKALMDEDRFLSADEAVELGFATRMTEQLKAVAYVKPNNYKPMAITESDKRSFLEEIKGWLKPTNNADADNSQALAEKDAEIEQLKAEIEANKQKDEEITALKAKEQELEALKTASAQKDQALADAQAQAAQLAEKETEITALKTELDNVKNFVPGSGPSNTAAAPQQFADYGKEKTGGDPWNQVAENFKKKYSK